MLLSTFNPRLTYRLLEKHKLIRLWLEEIRNVTSEQERLNIYLEEVSSLVEPAERFLLPAFSRSIYDHKDRFYYQQELNIFDIKQGDKVLDIGSGGYPFSLATHLADLYEYDTTHRVETLVKDDRPLVICDICNLPFEDREFDFIYCSHVLEHVSHPEKACEEMMRVGRRGYIETPTRLSDVMFNFTKLQNHHRWHINLLNDTLIFHEWRDGEQRDTGTDAFFAMFHSKYTNPFQELVHRNRELFVNMLTWEGRFAYYVFNKNGKLIASG